MRTGYKNAAFEKNVGVFNPDRLVVGDTELLRHVEADIRIPDGVTYLRGTLMGRIYSASDEVAAPGNTGGTTFVVSVTGSQVLIGRYQVRCSVAGNAGAARYELYAPDGERLGNAFPQGAAHVVRGLSVNPTHNGNPVVGDTWSFRVVAGRWQRVDPKALSGAQIPAGVLVQEVTADNGAAIAGDAGHRSVDGHIFTQGPFSWPTVDLATEGREELDQAVVYNHGYELEDIRDRLGANGLILLDTIPHRNDPLETSADRSKWL